MEVNATILALSDMQRPLSQLRSIGPNSSLSSRRRCHRSEERAKNHAASIRNGVAGRPGSTMPTEAIARNSAPSGL
jgi:hypothetical protein